MLKEWIKSRLTPGTRLHYAMLVSYGVATGRLVHGQTSGRRATLKDLKRRLLRDGVFHDESELWMCSLLPFNLLDRIIERLSPSSVLDVGCGTGRSLDYLLAKGIDAFGIEGSSLAISRANNSDRIMLANLARRIDLGRRFDLVWSYEVVEHVHRRHVDSLMHTLTSHSDTVVVSAARPGQGGEGHLNEQPPEYWIGQFLRHDFHLDAELTQALRECNDTHAGNVLAFHRGATVGAATPIAEREADS